MAEEMKFVTFKIGYETFGIDVKSIREMLHLPKVHVLPQAASAEDNSGVIMLRSQVIPVFDLWRKFGIESRQKKIQEFVDMLNARQKDHENWLHELEKSIVEKREFTLTTNPHACAFGKWYDSFHTDDGLLSRRLQRFDQPHKAIHAVAAKVEEFQHHGEHDNAVAIVKQMRSTIMQSMIALFSETTNYLLDSVRPCLIVLGLNGHTLGIAVDDVHSVINTKSEEIQPLETLEQHNQFSGVVGLLAEKSSKKMIMLLDPCVLFPHLKNENTSVELADV